jgi:F0F1-type ATP synthase membrane subunit b/b'
MINTPEFWVGVSFFICVALSIKLILPKLKATMISHQQEIEKSFSDAENILKEAEKKFSVIQERLNSLPTVMAEMEVEFDAKVNHQIQEWNEQKERIIIQYASLQEYKLEHLTNHTKSQLHSAITTVSLKVLEVYFQQQITAKKHQLIVKDALKHLSNA